MIFTPPPAGPGKINEVPGQTGDPVIDSTTGSTGLSFGTATLNGPTFVWSKGSLTDGQKGDLTAASTLTLSDSGGSVGFTYSAVDHTFDFLAAGETLTVTYDVTVGGVTKSAVITVTGTNDTPVITSDGAGRRRSRRINRHAAEPDGFERPREANGAVTFTDVDLSGPSMTVTVTVAGEHDAGERLPG